MGSPITLHRHDGGKVTQTVGFEFFDINRYVPHLVDVATVTLMLEVVLTGGQGEWFLDHTNSSGEGLVTGSCAVTAYQLRLNDAYVRKEDLPLALPLLRRREYEWQFYQANDTSHAEMVDFLQSWADGRQRDNRLAPLGFELGLLFGHGLTLAGKSLLGRCSRSNLYECT